MFGKKKAKPDNAAPMPQNPPGPILDQEMVPVQSAPAPQLNLLPKSQPAANAKQGQPNSIGGFMKGIMGGA